MSTRSAFYALALVLAVALLLIFAAFGTILVLVFRGRRPGFSYIAGGMTTLMDLRGGSFADDR
jgi:hypothetical protein